MVGILQVIFYNRKNELCKNSKRIVQAEFIYYPLEAHY